MHTPLPEPCSCMKESGALVGNSCVTVIPLLLAGIDSKSGPGAETLKPLKLVDDQAGTLARISVGCAPATLKLAQPRQTHARQQVQQTKLHIRVSHKPNTWAGYDYPS